MYTKIKSFGLYGLNAFPVDVEISLTRGTPTIEIVGLPDNAVKESRERIRSALQSISIPIPPKRIIINLAPADVKKTGTMYDLGMLLGLLVGLEQLPPQPETRYFLGEVSLSGHVRRINGVLSMALLAAQKGAIELYVPKENAAEASAAGIDVYGVDHIADLFAYLSGMAAIPKQPPYLPTKKDAVGLFDFSEVKGQQNVRYALEVAASGGHNALMIGSPGSRKSMLAKRIPTILPEMTWEESMETTQVYSVAGMLDSEKPFLT